MANASFQIREEKWETFKNKCRKKGTTPSEQLRNHIENRIASEEKIEKRINSLERDIQHLEEKIESKKDQLEFLEKRKDQIKKSGAENYLEKFASRKKVDDFFNSWAEQMHKSKNSPAKHFDSYADGKFQKFQNTIDSDASFENFMRLCQKFLVEEENFEIPSLNEYFEENEKEEDK